MTRKELLELELLQRKRAATNLVYELFPEQLAFVSDTNQYTTAVCGRRSGKSYACSADLLLTCKQNAGVVCLYVTLTRFNAKRILWPIVCELNDKLHLGGKLRESDLSVTFNNGSQLFLSGAADKKQVARFRGMPLKKVYIDEAQDFPSFLQELIDEVFAYALFDHGGSLRMIGTVPPVSAGYFYECVEGKYSSGWSHHSWTMFENPHLKKKSGLTPQQTLERELKRRGVTIEDPVIQREVFAKWVSDLDSLVLHYEPTRNGSSTVPDLSHHILAIDLGLRDSDAIAAIGWNEKSPKAWLVEELITAGQGITPLVAQIEQFIKKYEPIKIVMDEGGLGAKIAEEIRRRYAIPVHPAEKVRKNAALGLLDDALKQGLFIAVRDSRFAHDCQHVQWEIKKEKRVISERFHSDIIDAVLYGFREALNYLYEPPKPTLRKGTREYDEAEEAKMLETAIELEKSKEEDPTPWDGGSGYDPFKEK